MHECSLARESSVTLSHPESEEEMEEQGEEEQGEEEQGEEEQGEEEEEEINGENDGEDQSLTEDVLDGESFNIDRQQRESSSSSSSRGSFEEMRSLSHDESLEKTSTISEDVEELESSLDGSLSSSFKQRSLDVYIV